MKTFLSFLDADDTWLIKDFKWVKELQGIRESQFAIGNGFIGTRGILEEIPHDCSPGTYIAGIYDGLTARVSELVNFPNPFNFKLRTDGEKVGVMTMDIVEHERLLNMQKGVLLRRTVYRDSKRRTYEYQSARFLSMHDKNIGVMHISFTALDGPVDELAIETGIDTSVFNCGMLTEGNKKHFRLKEAGQSNNAGYLIVETHEKRHTLIYRSGFHYKIGAKKTTAKDNIFTLKLKKGQQITFTKIFHITALSNGEDLAKSKRVSERKFAADLKKDFNTLLMPHVEAWSALWKQSDILIRDTFSLQKNLRFNIYHMLICGGDNNGFSSICAKTLSGEGYKGHIFWDVELFLLPFYIYTAPDHARSMLLYRYKRLHKARERAKAFGCKGAMFPWESAGSGEDVTPTWAKNIDGSIIKILTDKFEHHITADIAFAVNHYYLATGDEKFMDNYGYELLAETARFWSSRVTFNRKKYRYEILHVIGPDEFHEDVNNNAYTNMLAKWNLLTACKMLLKIKQRKPGVYHRVEKRIGLAARELNDWKRIAARMHMNVRKDKVIEQFDGFFRKKRVQLKERNENGIFLIPRKISVKEIAASQIIKQADVLMLLYVLSDFFSLKTKKINYDFYSGKTVHKSSLSPAIHSMLANECGDMSSAYQFFNVSLHADISNLNRNTEEGIHAASLGGTWQAAVNGFAGVRINREILSVNPRLPSTWSKMIFSLKWRGTNIRFDVKNKRVKLYVSSKKEMRVALAVFGERHMLATNKWYVFRKREGELSVQQYY